MALTLRGYLATASEALPIWISKAEQLDSANAAMHFLSSRLVFYPGSRFDGGPIACFNSSHAVHCFIYVDYGVEAGKMQRRIDKEGFRGYRSCRRIELQPQHLAPTNWVRHAQLHYPRYNTQFVPYGFIEIFERVADFDDSHGAKRFAVLFLGADGFATFDALFCGSMSAPWCIVLQDHGFGGNYDCFGAGGLLEKLAQFSRFPPRFLLKGAHTRPWANYALVPNVLSERMSYGNRKLFERVTDVG